MAKTRRKPFSTSRSLASRILGSKKERSKKAKKKKPSKMGCSGSKASSADEPAKDSGIVPGAEPPVRKSSLKDSPSASPKMLTPGRNVSFSGESDRELQPGADDDLSSRSASMPMARSGAPLKVAAGAGEQPVRAAARQPSHLGRSQTSSKLLSSDRRTDSEVHSGSRSHSITKTTDMGIFRRTEGAARAGGGLGGAHGDRRLSKRHSLGNLLTVPRVEPEATDEPKQVLEFTPSSGSRSASDREFARQLVATALRDTFFFSNFTSAQLDDSVRAMRHRFVKEGNKICVQANTTRVRHRLRFGPR